MKKVLLTEAYNYYPKNISPFDNRGLYLKSNEFKKLKETIINRHVFPEFKKDDLIRKLNKIINKEFKDFSLFNWNDRAYNIQVVLKEENLCLDVLCVNVSVLIPYFTIYVLRIEKLPGIIKLKCPPKLDDKLYVKYKKEVNLIEGLLIEDFDLKKISKNFQNEIIEDIGFEDIDLGKFTFFNAFFLNDYNHSRF